MSSQKVMSNLTVSQAFDEGNFVSASLTRPVPVDVADAQMPDLQKVDFKPVLIKGQKRVQLTYGQRNRVLHRNLTFAEALTEFEALLAARFTHGVVHISTGHLALKRKGAEIQSTLVRDKVISVVPLEHNRTLNRILPEGTPVNFLIRLGVMSADGKVIASKYDKFRQINRFLEMVDDVWSELEPLAKAMETPLRIIDFGSGKSYLTFALYHYLTAVKGASVKVTGLDLKQDVIQECAAIAKDLGFDALEFQVGDIAGFESERADMVVSLHACDTATDDALKQAVNWQASVILAVPCCQHELFKQTTSTVNLPLLKHGILKERLSALITDAVRAEWLETCGYRVQVMEFIETAHTPKNLLIRAVRANSANKAETDRLQAFCEFWHVQPQLLS